MVGRISPQGFEKALEQLETRGVKTALESIQSA